MLNYLAKIPSYVYIGSLLGEPFFKSDFFVHNLLIKLFRKRRYWIHILSSGKN